MEQPLKLIFLDIDGVLNCNASETFYSVEHPESYGIDEKLWGNLSDLLNQFPDVKVVIHSGWIKHKNEPDYTWDMGFPEKGIRLKSQLPEVIKRLGDRYLDCVPYLKGQPKYERIKKWMEDNRFFANPKSDAIVLDDDRSEYSRIAELENLSDGGIAVLFTDPDIGLDGEVLDDAELMAWWMFGDKRLFEREI